MQPANTATSLSREDQQQLDKWLQEFDHAWDEGKLARRVGELPPPGPLRAAALGELVKADLRHHWQQGRKKALESYLLAYPELGTPETVSLELIQAEMQIRKQAGDSVSWHELSTRFPKQTAQLRRGMEQLWQKAPADTAPPTAPTDADISLPGAIEETLRPGTAALPTGYAGPKADALPLPDDRYLLLRELGRGAMGTVYLARDTKLDREVALKIPHFRTGDNPDLLARFHREARAAATLHHRNICPVYDVGEKDGIPYLTMAYIEGQPLGVLLRKQRALPQQHAVEIVYKLARALALAHARGVIHRDLKPSNIMIDREGEPVVMDFGLARRTGQQDIQLTHEGSVLGTPAYMSPEQVNGDQMAVGPTSDVYSLGVIFYELLAGQVPFQGGMGQVMAQILTEKPRPPHELRPDLDPDLEAICLQAMASKASERYASMSGLAEALANHLTIKPRSSPDIITTSDSQPVIDHSGTEVLTRSVVAPSEQGAVGPRPRWLALVAVAGSAGLVLAVLMFLVWKALQKEEVGTVTVAITSTPPGATVFLDDKRQEPVREGVYAVRPGAHDVRLELARHQTRREQIVVGADGRDAPFHFTLKPEKQPDVLPPPSPVAVTIQTEPPGATVVLADKPEQVSPATFQLAPGKHHVRLQKSNYRPREEMIEVAAKQRNEFEYKLSPILYRLMVKANRKGATATLEGMAEKKPTPAEFELPMGRHKIKVELAGHEPQTQVVEVRAGQAPATVQADLVPLVRQQFALLVGVRHACKDLPDFVHAEPDVTELGRLLVAGGYPRDNVVVMTLHLGKKDANLLPSGEAIRRQLQRLTSKCKRPDSLLVALVGHAVQFAGGDDSYFCPADATLNKLDTLLPLAKVYVEMHERCEAKERLLLLDCWRHDWKDWVDPAGVVRERPKQLFPLGGPVRWVSCAAGKRGYEDPDTRHGMFFKALLRALRMPGGAQRKLPAEVQRRVVEMTRAEFPESQTPELLEGDPNLPWWRLRIQGALAAYSRGCDHAEKASQSKSHTRRLAEYRNAIEAFDEAAAMDPSFFDVFIRRAAAHYHCGEFAKAIVDCDAALKLEPDDATANSHRAEALTRLKRYPEALLDHEKAIERDPAYARAYNTRGETYFAEGKIGDAINEFSEALSHNPRLKWARYYRGRAYLRLKKPLVDDAIKDQTEALAVDPHFVSAWFERGLAYVRKKEYKTAIEDLSEAIRFNGDFAPAYFALREVYVARDGPGDREAARAADKRYKELKNAAP